MNTVTPATYSDVFSLLERYQVRYVVVGGIAVVLHGHLRPIADLDIVVAPTPDEQDRALQVLMLAGFVPSIPVPLSLLRVLRMFDQSEREIDVFVRFQVSFDELWADAVEMRVGEGLVRVISLEHLCRAKRISANPQDLIDIKGLALLTEQDRSRTGGTEDSLPPEHGS